MILRPYVAGSDLEVCEGIFLCAWNGAFPSNWRKCAPPELGLEFDEERVTVAVDRDRVVGFSSIWEPGAFHHHLYVEPSDHGRGAGSMLLWDARAFVSEQRLSLKCKVENDQALRFYCFHGFREGEETGEDSWGKWVSLRDAHNTV